MSRILKTYLLWLLIAALPMQSMAAVVNMSCGTAHHDFLSPVLSEVQPDQHMRPHHMHHHGAQVVAMDDHHATSATDSIASHQHHHPKHSSCSACAACCVGAAAPPPAALWSPETARSESVTTPSPVLHLGFVPSSLDRPPRHFSA
jgi:hypothetical protein